jgi:hypothetical protein
MRDQSSVKAATHLDRRDGGGASLQICQKINSDEHRVANADLARHEIQHNGATSVYHAGALLCPEVLCSLSICSLNGAMNEQLPVLARVCFLCSQS